MTKNRDDDDDKVDEGDGDDAVGIDEPRGGDKRRPPPRRPFRALAAELAKARRGARAARAAVAVSASWRVADQNGTAHIATAFTSSARSSANATHSAMAAAGWASTTS